MELHKCDAISNDINRFFLLKSSYSVRVIIHDAIRHELLIFSFTRVRVTHRKVAGRRLSGVGKKKEKLGSRLFRHEEVFEKRQ